MSLEADEKAISPSTAEGEGLKATETGGGTIHDLDSLTALGYKPELKRNRSLYTLLFQSLAIAAIPYGEGGPLISAIYGGGQLSIFLGWIMVLILDECVALSLSELASRYPTSAGPYYWSFQIAKNHKTVLSFITGWIWLIGNWTITLSVNFGFASLLSATIAIYHPDFAANDWQLLLIFYLICILSFLICAFGNKFLPMVDTICAAWTAISIFVILVALSVKADVGRHSAAYTLGHYDTSLSGWGGFTFFIGLLPAAYTFSAIGMISSMAEEVSSPATVVPKALALCVPVGGTAGLFFIIPICATMPPLADIITAPSAQAIPYIFHIVMGTPGGGLGLTFLILGITAFCSISITVAASRCTWAFARDEAIPGSRIFGTVNKSLGIPVNALALVTIVQMLLGLINLGSTSAFTAFVSVGVIALAVSYAIPIGISLIWDRRAAVSQAQWNVGHFIGTTANIVALCWITFEVILFSMPTVLPVTSTSMSKSFLLLSRVYSILQVSSGFPHLYVS